MARRNSAQKTKTALKKSQRKRARRGPSWLAYQLKLQEASDCLLDGELDEAREILEELDDRYPDQLRILETLLELHWQEDDYFAYYVTARRLLQLDASDPQAHLRMGGCLERHDASAAALLHFREYLKRTNSSDPLAEQVRKTVTRMETPVQQLLDEVGLTGEDALECLALNEETIVAANAEETKLAIRLGEQLTSRWPDFLPGWDNLSSAWFEHGDAQQAIRLAESVLERDPDSVYALANMARFQFLRGDFSAAQNTAQRLAMVQAEGSAVLVKRIETCAFLGDDAGVIQALPGFLSNRREVAPEKRAQVYHLVATAFWRQGQLGKARRYWKRAKRIDPDQNLARECLEDLQRKPGEQFGPGYYELPVWFSSAVLNELYELGKYELAEADEAWRERCNRLMEKHPGLLEVFSAVLDRGDAGGIDLLIRFLRWQKSPEMMELLRQFALGKRGPDVLRLRLANLLRHRGVLQENRVTMWRNGQSSTVTLCGIEVYTLPETLAPEPQLSLATDAFEFLQQCNAEAALPLFEEAVREDPDAKELWNNLAETYAQLGRQDKAMAISEELMKRFPDYMFPRIRFCCHFVETGDLQRAEEYLLPVLGKKRLHITEFIALSNAAVYLFCRQNDWGKAESWIESIRQLHPDYANLGFYERQCRLGLLEAVVQRRASG